MKWRRSGIASPLFWFWLLGITIILWPSTLVAHGGGTPQLVNVMAGPYQLSVWTQPNSLRVGEAHFSVAVKQLTTTTEPQDDEESELTVTLLLSVPAPAEASTAYQTTRQTRLFQVYYEADLLLPAAGVWSAEVLIDGAGGHGTAPFTFAVLPAQSLNWTVISWSTLAAIAMIGIMWAQRGAKP